MSNRRRCQQMFDHDPQWRGVAGRKLTLESLEPRRLLAIDFDLKDINAGPSVGGSYPSDLEAVGSTAFFIATTPLHGLELWKTDGTETGTVLVKDIRAGSISSFTPSYPTPTSWLTNVGGTLFFVANDGGTGPELWKSDGTAAGTVRVKDILPG
jgi:ELWxxDGT repeat protein